MLQHAVCDKYWNPACSLSTYGTAACCLCPVLHCSILSVYNIAPLLIAVQCIVYSVQCTEYSVRCTVRCTMYLTLHSFSLKLCSATIDLKQCKVYCVQCTVGSCGPRENGKCCPPVAAMTGPAGGHCGQTDVMQAGLDYTVLYQTILYQT